MKLTRLAPRIPTEQPKGSGWSKEGRGSASERGYGWAWQKLRDRIMARDHGLCQPCLRRGAVSLAKAVDHVTPKDQGGDDSPANLQAICDPCHKAKTAAEAYGGEWDGLPLARP